MTETDQQKVQAWTDKFGDPDKTPLKETLELCQQEFARQGEVRDVLDRGLAMLLAGADIDPELLKEGSEAARLLREVEDAEREIWKDAVERTLKEGVQHFMGVNWIVTMRDDLIKMKEPVFTEDGQVFDMNDIRPRGGPFENVSYVGTPKDGPNPFEEMFRMASQVGQAVVCHGGSKPLLEECDEPIIVNSTK